MLKQNPCRPDQPLRARGGPDPVRRALAFSAAPWPASAVLPAVRCDD
jgi:hypothetical protein